MGPRRRLPFIASLTSVSALAAERACHFGYAGFEEKHPQHQDLDLCPGGQVKPDEGFCRIALQGADVIIYEFRHVDGEPCLTRADRYTVNDFIARFGATYTKP